MRAAISKRKVPVVKAKNGGKFPSAPAKKKAHAPEVMPDVLLHRESAWMESHKANRNPTKLKAGCTPVRVRSGNSCFALACIA